MTSIGTEKNEKDNVRIDKIVVKEISNLVIIGNSSAIHFKINDPPEMYNMSLTLQISNVGPSRLSTLNYTVSIPTAYQNRQSQKWMKILDNINLEQTYNGELFQPPSKIVSYNSTEAELEAFSNVKQLPLNESLILTCPSLSGLVECTEYFFQVKRFEADEIPTMIDITFTLHPESLEALALEKKDFLFLGVSTHIQTPQNASAVEITVLSQQTPGFIIFKSVNFFVEFWYILGAIGLGLLKLAVILFVLHKNGFFRRKKKEELKRLTRLVSL